MKRVNGSQVEYRKGRTARAASRADRKSEKLLSLPALWYHDRARYSSVGTSFSPKYRFDAVAYCPQPLVSFVRQKKGIDDNSHSR